MQLEDIKFDCKHFRGDIPCQPNKTHQKICKSCNFYEPISKRILIIKLGAIGDVIRTTPLITKFKNLYPGCHITWITLSPEILPKNEIDLIYKWDFNSIYAVKQFQYDISINLDKDIEACALLSEIKTREKFGFTWKDQHIHPASHAAEHKLITGIFDNISKTNTKNYLEEIFEICHLTFNDEPYLINFNTALAAKWQSIKHNSNGKKIVGLNTGCGTRWQTRLWPQEKWMSLIRTLQENNFFPLLLGGKNEDIINKFISEKTGAYYPGHFSVEEFIAISSNADIIVSQVTMMMHIAIALKKPLVLLNNIFNANEYYLYNNGIIIEPSSGCDCYYGNVCSREKSCMLDIDEEIVFTKITELIK